MSEPFLANVPKEGDTVDIFESKGQEGHEDPSASPAGKQESGSPSPDGGNNPDDIKGPFHKHPRWIERENQWNAKFTSQEAAIADLKKTIEGLTKQEKKDFVQTGNLPDWFVQLYGNNPEAYKIMEEKMFGSLEERILGKIRSQQEEEQKAAKEGEKYVSSELQAMKGEGLEFDDNEFMKFLVDFKEKYGALPYDEQNRIDLRKGYDLWQQLKPAETKKTTTNTRKSIADFTTKKTNPSVSKTQGEQDVMTSKDLRHKDWRSLID